MKTNMKNNTNFKENEEKRNLKMIAQNPCGCRESYTLEIKSRLRKGWCRI